MLNAHKQLKAIEIISIIAAYGAQQRSRQGLMLYINTGRYERT
jgi:hypothetical protein